MPISKSRRSGKKHDPQKALEAQARLCRRYCKLSESSKTKLREHVEAIFLRLYMGSADATDFNFLATYFAYGYAVAVNFNGSEEMQNRFKVALGEQIRLKADLSKGEINKERIALLEEAMPFVLEMIFDLTLMEFDKLRNFIMEHGQTFLGKVQQPVIDELINEGKMSVDQGPASLFHEEDPSVKTIADMLLDRTFKIRGYMTLLR